MDEQELRAQFAEAEKDEAGRLAREEVCRRVGATLRDGGELLWVGGYALGTDRRDGRSPFGFGDDATVGLATVMQVGAELTQGAVALFDRGGLYAGAALVRQLVEVEYLAWAFAEDRVEAMDWLRSGKDERLARWQPGRIRKRSGGRFRASDYAGHCERGGHPTPRSKALLPGHSQSEPLAMWWLDLAQHALSAWDYGLAASPKLDLDYSDELAEVAARNDLPAVIAAWRERDPLLALTLERPWEELTGAPATVTSTRAK